MATWASRTDHQAPKPVDGSSILSSDRMMKTGGHSLRWVQRMGTESAAMGTENDGFLPIFLPLDPSRRGHHSRLNSEMCGLHLFCPSSGQMDRSGPAWRPLSAITEQAKST
ncbi:hypothetical protein SPHINGO391_510194 [Sphingomonas aurantiaca]|uniref:Uncharacterized protein n=1 Tax=Sphingomonas aurantiaca TaxID=185949 RepID=A0A5E8ALU1_9SPHN|nr:hypothetical protein SPHINGO391_510194 [Sphingomonas aurantiaca]